MSAETPGTTVAPSRPEPPGSVVWAALLAVYVIWGSTYLGIKISVETLPPFLSSALRFLLAGVVLAAILAARKGFRVLRVSWREAAAACLAGLLLLAFGNGLVVLAESGSATLAVPSGIAALLVATVPLLVVVLRAVSGDRPRLATVLGVLVGFAGLIVLVLPRGGGSAPIAGTLLVVTASVSWSLGSVLSRWVTLPKDPFVATVYETTTGGLLLLVMSLVRGEPARYPLADVSTRSWLALVYLFTAGSLVAFTAYVWLLHHAPISLVATYAYVNPVVAVALGALLVAEPVTPQILFGGAVIVVGVVLVVSTERRRPRLE